MASQPATLAQPLLTPRRLTLAALVPAFSNFIVVLDMTAYIANLVDREATTMAVDYIFLVTAAVFFLCAVVVWFAPKPKGFGGPAKTR